MGLGRRAAFFSIVLAGAGACSTAREPGTEAHVAPADTGAAPRAAAESASAPSSSPPSASAAPAASASAPATPAAEQGPPGDRIYAKARFVWIQPAPRGSRGWIGYLTLGGSVRLKNGSATEAKTIGPGCEAWYAVEPAGYVCLGPETTLDPNDPTFVALKAHAGNTNDPFPYRYGESLGTPRYEKAPDPAAQREREWDLEQHLAELSTLGVDTTPANRPLPDLPTFTPLVREARSSVARGSTVAWSAEYDAFGRTWLYTSDHALVPKDRVVPYPKRTFQGVHLDDHVTLPLAFFRKKDRPQYRRDGDAFVATDRSFARLSYVMLTGVEQKSGADVFLETKEAGVWVKAEDAAVASARGPVPYRDNERSERRTWIDVSVLGGTLVAYEGERPVFATLISPGRGGIPFPGRDPISTASTPTGGFRVDGKFRTATMVSSTDSSIVHSEVQFVQNFHGPHALHGAYWHDAWGEPKSGGCVNLSPADSKWLFEWTEPRLPVDWHGVRSVEELGPPTRVMVRP